MPRKSPYKYVVEDKTDGVFRFYFRRKGQKKICLPGHPGNDEFKAAYYAALNGTITPENTGPKMAGGGTFRWLCQQYFQSAEYRKLELRTQRVRKGII